MKNVNSMILVGGVTYILWDGFSVEFATISENLDFIIADGHTYIRGNIKD